MVSLLGREVTEKKKKKARMNHMVLDQNPDVNELGFSFNTDTDG